MVYRPEQRYIIQQEWKQREWPPFAQNFPIYDILVPIRILVSDAGFQLSTK